jgi:SAM-dependent methyltransferase
MSAPPRPLPRGVIFERNNIVCEVNVTETSEVLRQRDADEIERSRQEAEETELTPCDVERYLSPPGDSAFPLEYTFYLVGDIANKTVLDLGCGTGESVVVLVHKGARVIGIDISPELVDLARRRVQMQCAGLPGPELLSRSGYETGLGNASVDVVLSNALLHHLDLPTVLKEMQRILKPGGRLIINEPVRLLRFLAVARRLFPDRGNISEYEHPLTAEEYAQVQEFFSMAQERAFRLPFVSLAIKLRAPQKYLRRLQRLDCWLLTRFSFLRPLAGVRVAAFSVKPGA